MNVAGSLQAVRDWIYSHFYTKTDIALLFVNAGLGNIIKPEKIVYEDVVAPINLAACMPTVYEDVETEVS